MTGAVVLGELGGRYRVGDLLAVGGQGSVYAVIDERDGRELVLKVALAPGDRAARLAATRLAALAEEPGLGPHLVPVWDVGRWGDRDFVVLERLERTLADAAPAAEEGRAGVLLALVRAMAAFERAGEVHGDLKPSNVFVRDEADGVLLGDLWCGSGPAPVSAGFTAPEVWRGRPPSLASDRYALGATLWTLLAGGPPSAALRGPHARSPDRRSLAEAGIGAPWDRAVRGLLDPDPRRRPRVEEVLARLEERAPRPRRRLAGGLAVVALAATAAALALPAGRASSGPLPCPSGFVADGAICRSGDGRAVALVPPGTFLQGATEDERRWGADAIQRSVTLAAPTWFRTTEVTQREFREVTGEEPVRDRTETLPDGSVVPCATWEGHATVGPDLPVACVSWTDAVRFANAASTKDGLAPAYTFGPDGEVTWDRAADGWRLPTEAEWEWAAGGAASGERWAGAPDRDHVCGHANVRAQDAPERWGNEVPCADGAPVLAPVGSYAPNALGLHDALGNVSEWTWDRWEERRPGAVTDPTGAPAGALRVYRGAAWNQVARPISDRYATEPVGHGLNGGFRLVRTAR